MKDIFKIAFTIFYTLCLSITGQAQTTSLVAMGEITTKSQEIGIGISSGFHDLQFVGFVKVGNHTWNPTESLTANSIRVEAEAGVLTRKGLFTLGVESYSNRLVPNFSVYGNVYTSRRDARILIGGTASPVRSEVGIRAIMPLTTPKWGKGCY